MNKKYIIRLAILILSLFFSGCGDTDTTTDKDSVTDAPVSVSASYEDGDADYFADTADDLTDFKNEERADNSATSSEDDKSDSVEDASGLLSEIPDYTGKATCVINGDVPFFSEEEKRRTDAFETYSPLDASGRCGVAYANICKAIQPTEERGPIGHVRPSGWHTVKYNDLIDGNYLYNRCHLIGYQLAGENDNTRNLITGTRYLNVVGMLSFENEVDDYVERTNHHVLYRVTPLYEGNNLVADGVLMEAYSVEDNGKGICFNRFCYNVQPGIVIDYADGDSYVDEKSAADIIQNASERHYKSKKNVVDAPNQDMQGEDMVWVPNRGGTKYHDNESCGNMKGPSHIPKEEAVKRGYEPCKRCY